MHRGVDSREHKRPMTSKAVHHDDMHLLGHPWARYTEIIFAPFEVLVKEADLVADWSSGVSKGRVHIAFEKVLSV